MGQAKLKQLAAAQGEYVDVRDLRGWCHPCEDTPEGDLLITEGPYAGRRIRVPRRETT